MKNIESANNNSYARDSKKQSLSNKMAMMGIPPPPPLPPPDEFKRNVNIMNRDKEATRIDKVFLPPPPLGEGPSSINLFPPPKHPPEPQTLKETPVPLTKSMQGIRHKLPPPPLYPFKTDEFSDKETKPSKLPPPSLQDSKIATPRSAKLFAIPLPPPPFVEDSKIASSQSVGATFAMPPPPSMPPPPPPPLAELTSSSSQSKMDMQKVPEKKKEGSFRRIKNKVKGYISLGSKTFRGGESNDQPDKNLERPERKKFVLNAPAEDTNPTSPPGLHCIPSPPPGMELPPRENPNVQSKSPKTIPFNLDPSQTIESRRLLLEEISRSAKPGSIHENNTVVSNPVKLTTTHKLGTTNIPVIVSERPQGDSDTRDVPAEPQYPTEPFHLTVQRKIDAGIQTVDSTAIQSSKKDALVVVKTPRSNVSQTFRGPREISTLDEAYRSSLKKKETDRNRFTMVPYVSMVSRPQLSHEEVQQSRNMQDVLKRVDEILHRRNIRNRMDSGAASQRNYFQSRKIPQSDWDQIENLSSRKWSNLESNKKSHGRCQCPDIFGSTRVRLVMNEQRSAMRKVMEPMIKGDHAQIIDGKTSERTPISLRLSQCMQKIMWSPTGPEHVEENWISVRSIIKIRCDSRMGTLRVNATHVHLIDEIPDEDQYTLEMHFDDNKKVENWSLGIGLLRNLTIILES